MKIKKFQEFFARPFEDNDPVISLTSTNRTLDIGTGTPTNNLMDLQNSIIVNFSQQKNGAEKNEFLKKLSLLYDFESVVKMSKIKLETKNNLKNGSGRGIIMFNSAKSNDLFNLLTHSEAIIEKRKSISYQKNYKHFFSKVYQSKKTGKFRLLVYNSLKITSRYINLESFLSLNIIPSKNHTFGIRTGYYFIYDNNGIIHIILEQLKVCELILPDMRLDPTLYTYETNYSGETILFVAGGYIKQGPGNFPLDNIAIFNLNLREISKMNNFEPILYIKLKYPRISPMLFIFKHENEANLIILGGNVLKKLKIGKKNFDHNIYKNWFEEANLMCETITIKRIKSEIFENTQTSKKIYGTEDSLYVIVNGKEVDEDDKHKKNNDFIYYFGDASMVKVIEPKNKKKIYFIFGLGLFKNEVWYIDMIDFIEHKIYIYKSKCGFKNENGGGICSAMMTKTGDEIYYFENEEFEKEDSYQKIDVKHLLSRKKKSKCMIF